MSLTKQRRSGVGGDDRDDGCAVGGRMGALRRIIDIGSRATGIVIAIWLIGIGAPLLGELM